MGGIRTLIAVGIAGGALVLLALWIRGGEADSHEASAVSAAGGVEERVIGHSAALEADPPPESDRASLIETAPTAGPMPILATAGSVGGLILDPNRTPIASSGVSLVDVYGSRRSSTASETGQYEIVGVPFGSYTLVADALGYVRVEEQLDLGADRPEVQQDITLVPQPRIRVRVVTPDGLGLQQALEAASPKGRGALLVPVATREPPGDSFDEIRGSLNNQFGVGSFWFQGPHAAGLDPEHIGVLLLDAELPVYVSLVHYHHVLQTIEIPAGEDEATFVVSVEAVLADLATLRFRVEDERSGRPISEGSVQSLSTGMSVRKIGSDGLVTIDGVPPGLYRLHVVARGYEALELSIDAKPGVADLEVLRLREALRAVVRVVDEEGNPRDAKFYLRVLDPETRRVVARDDSRIYGCKPSGLLELTNLGRRLYCLQVVPIGGQEESSSWVSRNVLLDTRNGSVPEVEVVLRPASHLVLRTDSPEPQVWAFEIYDDQDLWVKWGRLHDRLPRPIEVAPGTYRVAVCDLDGKELSSRSVTIGKEPVLLELSR